MTGAGDYSHRDHERARELAAGRHDGFLTADESAWLDAHLAGCAACSAVAASYEAQRSLFAPARTAYPVPPRDLWARTAAAIEIEGRRRSRRRVGPRLLYAPLAGVLVVAIVVGAGLLNSLPGKDTTKGEEPEATPFALDAPDVEVLARNDAGQLELRRQAVAQVCPTDAESCGLSLTPEKLDTALLMSSSSYDAVISPDQAQMVVVERGEGGSGVYVVDVRKPAQATSAPPAHSPVTTPATATVAPSVSPAPDSPSPTATATATAAPSTSASASPSASASASPGASASGSPSPSASPSDAASASPSTTPATAAPTNNASVAPSVAPSQEPTEPPSATASASPSPSSSPSASASPRPTPSVEVTPLPNGTVEIASDVVVADNASAYSPDGTRFAFSARPTDGSAGPDVFVWRVGTARAKAVTDDHASLFAGWIGDRVLVSRVVDGRARTVILSLDTGATVSAHDDQMWRPTIGPADETAVWWDGDVKRAANGFDWVPGTGRLVLGSWPASGDATDQVLAGDGTTDWQVQWDPSGTYLASWTTTAGPGKPGTLSLYRIDPATRRADLEHPKLDAAPSYEGFSLRKGRLTWSAPAAAGDRTVQVLAWKGDTFGRFEILTTDGTTVVR